MPDPFTGLEPGAADIGVFGGSGFYSFLTGAREVRIDTPYGPPSDRVVLAEVEGRRVAFMPRHGRDHSRPAHAVNYRANVFAMHALGVRQILAPCACGSLQPGIHPGDFVLLDQFVDRTRGRLDTYFDGPVTHHIAGAEPYCNRLRSSLLETIRAAGIPYHPSGTMVVIQGPRFSTRAESHYFTACGWHVVGMTQHPEAILARELGICYAAIALVTDYDVGVAGDMDRPPVAIDEVLAVMHRNNEHVRDLILRTIETLPVTPECACGEIARNAVVSRE